MLVERGLGRSRIGLPLIPNHAANSVWHQRRDLAIEEASDVSFSLASGDGILRSSRRRFFSGFGFLHRFLPGGEVAVKFSLRFGRVKRRVLFFDCGEKGLEFCRGSLSFGADPRFDRSSTDG